MTKEPKIKQAYIKVIVLTVVLENKWILIKYMIQVLLIHLLHIILTGNTEEVSIQHIRGGALVRKCPQQTASARPDPWDTRGQPVTLA